MKGKRILFGVIMVAVLLVILGRPSISDADTFNGAWLPNDIDVFMIELTSTTGTGSFYMYDWGDTDKNLFLINDGSSELTTATFTYDDANKNWMVTTTTGGSLNIGSSQEFGLYFSDNTIDYFSYNLIATTPGEVYTLYDENTEMTIVVSDAAPVPITTSALLLGSGVLGLIALGRRRMTE